jgi:hypothetical protein
MFSAALFDALNPSDFAGGPRFDSPCMHRDSRHTKAVRSGLKPAWEERKIHLGTAETVPFQNSSNQ